MPFIVTAASGNHMRSCSLPDATASLDVVEECLEDGYRILLILDGTYHKLTEDDLRNLAAAEAGSRR